MERKPANRERSDRQPGAKLPYRGRPPAPGRSAPRSTVPLGRPGRGETERRVPAPEGVSPEWMGEIRKTARPGRLERVAELISKALREFGRGEYHRAVTVANEAKAFAPRSALIRELIGLSYYSSGEWKDALRELLTFRRISGRKDQNHVIADCYRALGRPEKALEVCHEVSSAEVGIEIWTEILIVAASAYADLSQTTKGLSELARGELSPHQVEEHHLRLWYVRAELLEREGRVADANVIWERIYAEDPEFFDVSERFRR